MAWSVGLAASAGADSLAARTVDQGWAVERARRGGDPIGQIEGRVRGQVIGVGGDYDFAEASLRELEQFLGADGYFGAAVVDVALQLGGAIHRIHGHYDGAGAEDSVIGDDPLRGVLHVDDDAVSGLHSGAVAEPSGEGFDLLLQAAIGDFAAEERNGGVVGVALRRKLPGIAAA